MNKLAASCSWSSTNSRNWARCGECFATSSRIGFNSVIAAYVVRTAVSWNGAVPPHNRILAILRHPIYAGAYAYGFHRPGRKNPVSGQVEGGRWFSAPRRNSRADSRSRPCVHQLGTLLGEPAASE